MIISRNSKNALEDIMRDMKKFTSAKIIGAIKSGIELRLSLGYKSSPYATARGKTYARLGR